MLARIIGRERELAIAEAFLRESRHRPVALLLEGAPGIGKTTLWLSVAASADGRGFRVLRARPAESEAKLSFAGLADLVDPVFDQTRRSLPAPQERALAAALLRSDAEAPANARTTGAALVSVLELLAGSTPVLLAIDDAQWLDADSERVLRFALRRLKGSIGILATLRPDGAGGTSLGLGEGVPPYRVERLTLRPLSLASLHHLIRDRLGQSLPRPLLARLVAASDGNPFFALEIARALQTDTHDLGLGTPLPVPRSLHELVASRVRDLSRQARDVLLVAATLFRPTAPVVVALIDDGESGLKEAERAGVIEVTRGRIRFTHPLLASAVYGSAVDSDRRTLHRRLSEVVADPEERGHHLAQSALEPDERLAQVIEQGAEQAARRGAQDAAADLFEASARLTPEVLGDDLARRLMGEASALNAIGEFTRAKSIGELALGSCDAPALRVAGHTFLGTLAWFQGSAGMATGHLEQALDAAESDDQLLAPIYAKLVRFNFTHDFEQAVQYAEVAMHRLDEARAPMLLGHVFIDRFFGNAILGREPRRELLDRGLELEESSLATSGQPPHPIPLIWFLCVDEFDAARARFAIEDGWYRDRGEEVWQANRRAHLAAVELRAGRWELAERYAEESCAALQEIEVRGPMALIYEKRALVDTHRGRVDRARATLVQLVREFEDRNQAYWAALTLSTLAFAEYAGGDHDAVDQVLARMREHMDAVALKENVHDRSEPFHIESLVALGRVDDARQVLRRLEERGRVLPRAWIMATLPRARALVLAAEGNVDAALAALDELDLSVTSRLPFDLGLTLLLKGQLLRRAKQKRGAADALQQALGVFEELGAPSWIDQTRAEIRRIGLRASASNELTESERRVARLVATGLRNREVAGQLFMSPKTVEATLARVYRKLGIHSRAALGARVAEFESGSPQE